MIKVKLSGQFRVAAGGRSEVDIEAATIHQMLTKLGKAHPKLEPHLEDGVAVAINGEIYRDDWFRAIPPGAEVVLLPRLAGG